MNTNDDKTIQIIIIITLIVLLLFYTLCNKHTFTSQHAFKFHYEDVTQHFKDLSSLNVYDCVCECDSGG